MAEGTCRAEQKARTRERLLSATHVVIAREGLSSTTVARVAEEAGVSQGTVAFHFEGKQKLLREALRQLVERYNADIEVALAQAPAHPAARLQALVSALLRHAEDGDHLTTWYAFWGDASARAIYREVGGPVDARTLDIIVDLGRKLFPHHAETDIAEQMADTLMALVNGFWLSKLMRPNEVDLAKAERICMNIIDMLRAEVGPWPQDFERWLPAQSWVCQPVGELARKYDTVETHGWYRNLEPTALELRRELEPGSLWLDYSGGTGILVDRLLHDEPGLDFGALLVDASPKFLRLALEKLSADRRTAFRWIRYLKNEKRLQRLDEVLSPLLLERGFDALTSTNAIHLYYDMEETLRSWWKALRPGGLAHVQSGNIDNPNAGPETWIIDQTVERLQPFAHRLVREDPRFEEFRAATEDEARMKRYDKLRAKFFLPVRPLAFYEEQLQQAGFTIEATHAVPIEASVEEWGDFLAAYHEGVLGWAGGSPRVEKETRDSPSEATVALRRELLQASLEALFEGRETFEANWTYLTCRRA